MPERDITTIELNRELHGNLEEVKEFLEDSGYPNPSFKDAVFHLYRLWEHNLGKEIRVPEQSKTSTKE